MRGDSMPGTNAAGGADRAGGQAGTARPGILRKEHSDEHYRRPQGTIRARAAVSGRTLPPGVVAGPIRRAVRQFGRRGRTGRMAQEFGPRRPRRSVSGFVLRHDSGRNPAAFAYRQTLLGSPGTDSTGVFPR